MRAQAAAKSSVSSLRYCAVLKKLLKAESGVSRSRMEQKEKSGLLLCNGHQPRSSAATGGLQAQRDSGIGMADLVITDYCQTNFGCNYCQTESLTVTLKSGINKGGFGAVFRPFSARINRLLIQVKLELRYFGPKSNITKPSI